MIALENGEEKPIFEILNVDPNKYPSPEAMKKRQIKRKFRKLKRKLEKNSFSLELSEKLPALEAYRYLAETLLYERDTIHLAKGYTSHVAGCSSDCPSCFQLDYCDLKYDCWTEGKLQKEIDRRRKEDTLSRLLKA
jgi:hypothetical protein